jgi:hypothetical protein
MSRKLHRYLHGTISAFVGFIGLKADPCQLGLLQGCVLSVIVAEIYKLGTGVISLLNNYTPAAMTVKTPLV